ncbi:MAG: flagellar biosynthetic protein FliO [Deltaproteobacteria bacterium]|nr:flagellar biosynthetic protein FliO [Deltaproteobacteria bacterium]
MESAGELPGLGGSLAASLLSLGVVCLVAYLSLRFLSRRGVGRVSGPIKVLARCPLEPRRSLYLIETAGRCFLVGVGEGPMTMLAEVAAPEGEAVVVSASPPRIRFSDVLGRVLGRGTGSGPA